MVTRRGWMRAGLAAGLAVAGMFVGAPALAQNKLKVAAVYTVPIEQQWVSRIHKALNAAKDRGEIEYVPFPEHLKGRYQSYTQADIGNLRRAGYSQAFLSVEEGVARYLAWLEAHAGG